MAKNHPADETMIALAIDIVSAYAERVSDLLRLAALETQLAVKSVMALLMLVFLLGTLLTACWVSLTVLIYFYLISLQYSAIQATGMMVSLNLIALIGLICAMYKLRRNLLFKHTRTELSHFKHDDTADEKYTTRN